MEIMKLFSKGIIDNKGLIHYSGKIGEFDYDPQMFVKLQDAFGDFLHYCGDGNFITLPSGVISTRNMFTGCKLPENFTLGDHFDTSNVTDMDSMFYNCKLPENFTLGNHFDTSNVTNMSNMFAYCKLPVNFTLGNHFNTSKVTDMRSMFYGCNYQKTLL